ncbi:MAG: GHKL domain-containing protein [Bacteroidales bacterium]|nr:GHKL domain-containing protein [Bacteroidales bacterium]
MISKRLLIISLIIITISVLLANFSGIFENKLRYAKNVQQILHQKCEQVEKYFNKLDKCDQEYNYEIIQKLDHEDIILFRYINNQLVYWSSNAIPVFENYPDTLFNLRMIKIFNSYYHVISSDNDSVKNVGLIRIKNRYPYENDFLPTGFNPDFRLPRDTKISFQPENGYDIHDMEGNYLFGIILPDRMNDKTPRSGIATVFLFLGLILLGYYLYIVLKNLADKKKRLTTIPIVIFFISILRIIQLGLKLNIDSFALFDPFIYADSLFVPSLGDLLLNSLLILFYAILICRVIGVNNIQGNISKGRQTFYFVFYNLLALIFFIHAHYFFHSLIFNSNMSFQPNAIDRLSIYSLISFLINGINFYALGIVLIWVIKHTILLKSVFRNLQVFFITSALIFIVLFVTGYPIDFISIVSYLLFFLLFLWFSYKNYNLSGYSFLVVFVLFFSVYSLLYIMHEAGKKEDMIRKSLAYSLTNEHDPVAEYLFEELSQDIKNDTSISSYLNRKKINIDKFYNYLSKNYFTGYWNKYNLQITLCGPTDSVLIEIPDYRWFYCYGFFDDIISEIGLGLPGSSFYYLDNYTGRISYVGRFPFKIAEFPYEITLFIELDSKITQDLLGYPELLLDQKFHLERLIDKYSYAKYYKGDLVAQYGDFSYSLSSEVFGDLTSEFQKVALDGYEHLLYSSESDNLIVISLPKPKFIDVLIAFSYLFLFYYVSLILVFAARNLNQSEIRFLGNLRSKIQFTIISILLVSLILIAGSTIWLNIRNYRKYQDTVLHEKIHSILIELTHKLELENELTTDWQTNKYDNLNQLLIKFSDVFYTDINLYNPNGELLATSRSEIFQRGLLGTKMDPTAFFKLSKEKRAQFIHRENIGNLSYLSAYALFENSEGKLLAYLNLPYFTKQKELQASLSALIVTIINIYVILILITIVITILISDQITRPLELLQLRFRDLKLGSRFEQIHYKRKDEIANLVNEYNRMVIELQRSIELLARSERESAWREMAKQIAHEIKNPLTPMRLSVQHLQKSWNDKHENQEEYLKNITNTLLEQIDNLSAIATEFSNFAKMPDAKIERVDLIEILKKSVDLFKGAAHYKIYFSSEHSGIEINADREQLSRLFMNIIKNAIQSVPDDRIGEIRVNVEKSSQKVIVLISDNGRGIPDEIKPKLFMPNFTTKSSGMGLGLAIVRNIMDNLDGEISFKTKLNEGTVFKLIFPVKTEKKMRE